VRESTEAERSRQGEESTGGEPEATTRREEDSKMAPRGERAGGEHDTRGWYQVPGEEDRQTNVIDKQMSQTNGRKT
jgi:hypothetical protein